MQARLCCFAVDSFFVFVAYFGNTYHSGNSLLASKCHCIAIAVAAK